MLRFRIHEWLITYGNMIIDQIVMILIAIAQPHSRQSAVVIVPRQISFVKSLQAKPLHQTLHR